MGFFSQAHIGIKDINPGDLEHMATTTENKDARNKTNYVTDLMTE